MNNGETVIHRAAESGSLDMVEYLVEKKGANPKAASKDGWTVLHRAAESGNLKLVQYLVNKHKADPNATTDSG